MPLQTLHNFFIERLEILGLDGQVDEKLDPNLDPDLLKKIYEEMLKLRQFDQRSISLQRQGRMGTFAAALGQEAIHIGSAAALKKEDWAVPCFREQGVYLYRGVPAHRLLAFFMGSESGNRFPPETHMLPYCVPCASQTLHATGIALAAKIKQDSIAVITYLGDGATSEGDFHEALNLASVHQLPVVFICQNNQWAISTPPQLQFHSKTIAQKALAYDMAGLQVDGNDVLAVYRATHEALTRARSGEGPTLLECISYRMGAHTTADDPSRYRKEEDVTTWQAKDPIHRFEKYLLQKSMIQEGERQGIEEKYNEQLKAEIEKAEAICKEMKPQEMFTSMYKNLPENLKEQMKEFL